MPTMSAGLLLYRWHVVEDGERRLQVLLVHPGGPYWAKKDLGAWSIPKGEVTAEELLGRAGAAGRPVGVADESPDATAGPADAVADLLPVARREVREETGLEPAGPFLPLGGVKAHHHKLVYAWAVEHDADAAAVASNTFSIEWPPRSGARAEFPEVDRAAWFDLPSARRAILSAQRRFVDDLAVLVGGEGGTGDGAGAAPRPEDQP